MLPEEQGVDMNLCHTMLALPLAAVVLVRQKHTFFDVA